MPLFVYPRMAVDDIRQGGLQVKKKGRGRLITQTRVEISNTDELRPSREKKEDWKGKT